MKPYNVEIFDRSINFKYSFLLDPADLSYQEDAMDPKKNTIPVPADFAPTSLDPNDPRAPRGWYLRILSDETEIQGIITVYESGEERGKITFSQLITRLDLNIFVGVGDITQYTVENYIKKLITDEFIESNDPKQVIPGLSTVTTGSSTHGTFNYTDTDKEQLTIDFLNDLVYPAFELFAIVTKVTFNPQTKTVSIRVGKSNRNAATIEADLPNVATNSFTIQKYSKEINKIDCYDMYRNPPIRSSYYLHPDGTWGSNPNTNRIQPVINTVTTVNAYAAAKAIIDAQLKTQMQNFIKYNNQDRHLTSSEVAIINIFADKAVAAYAAANPLSKPSISGSDNVSIGSTSYEVGAWPYDEYASSFYWEDDAIDGKSRLRSNYTSCNTHVMLQALVSATRTYGGQQWSGTAYKQKPFTSAMAESALSAYKKTAGYEAEIASIYDQAVIDIIETRVESLFAKNKYSNLIEISVLEKDTMVKPFYLEIGDTVNIIHKGVSYSSVLSGKSWEDGMVKLTFGTIRLELTSFLKGRY